MSPRIDTLRTSVTATIELLGLTLEHLDLLHSLAYDRAHAAEQIRVRGGLPDYALDSHGDPAAREALRQLSKSVASGRNVIAGGAHQALKAVRDRQSVVDNTRSRTQITAEEFIAAVEAQERRVARGEVLAPRVANQPVPAGVEKRLRDENKRLRKENQRLARRLAKLEAVK